MMIPRWRQTPASRTASAWLLMMTLTKSSKHAVGVAVLKAVHQPVPEMRHRASPTGGAGPLMVTVSVNARPTCRSQFAVTSKIAGCPGSQRSLHRRVVAEFHRHRDRR
jgi:hypothetical protein